MKNTNVGKKTAEKTIHKICGDSCRDRRSCHEMRCADDAGARGSEDSEDFPAVFGGGRQDHRGGPGVGRGWAGI